MTVAIQASFNSGEWSPKVYARVDLTKYRSAAALLENFFVDYRGGASTRPGTKYILQTYSPGIVRLIPFQASFAVGYVLEFGNQYIRFFYQGAPIVEQPTLITGAAGVSPTVFTDVAHGYSNNQWILAQGNYYIIQNADPNTFTLTDLFGNPINGNPFSIPVSAQRIYTLASPYLAAELAQIKFAQNVNELILCHPNHPPYVLALVTAANWTLTPITFGASITAPTTPVATSTLGAGAVNYAYVVTSVDTGGQESGPSIYASLSSLLDLRTTPGTNTITWAAVPGAASYNVYKAEVTYGGAVPAGSQLGYIGYTTDVSFVDSNIGSDFSQTPPVPQNPFAGTGVSSIAITLNDDYTGETVPFVTLTGGGGSGATAVASAAVFSVGVVNGGANYVIGDILNTGNGVLLSVQSVLSGGRVSNLAIISQGSINSGGGAYATAGPLGQLPSGGVGAIISFIWELSAIGVTNPGTGYATPPVVTFSNGGAAATATLGAPSLGNPTVPGFFQQRLVLAAPVQGPQTFYMSKPGAYFNFDVATISQPTNAITGNLVSGQLNTIRSMVPQTSGLLMFTDRNAWLINGGSAGSAISPSAVVANAQSFNGVSDVPPVVANFDVLYVQAKGSSVRDSAYNIYANVYTGTDVSVLSSHLFYGYTVTEWAWAEEPFKVLWAVRNDGVMLTLTFLKEQEFIGWAHSITQGSFRSVATVVENTPTAGEVDAVYTVVQRSISGVTRQFIERIAERTFINGSADAWTVDCGLQYTGIPAVNFSGAGFLGGNTVTGLADGVVIPPFVMPANGSFTLATAASKVTIGLGFTAKLQTLPLELGDPTVQGKPKKINGVDVLVADTLGLLIGSSFDPRDLTPMKDLIRGEVSSMLTGQRNQVVTDLVNGQAYTIIDPTYTIPGQYCIQQSDPLPATILGVVPSITIGDGGQRG